MVEITLPAPFVRTVTTSWGTAGLPARVEQLAGGLGMPVGRVAGWGFAQAVLSEVWTFEGDGTQTMRSLRAAQRLLPLLP